MHPCPYSSSMNFTLLITSPPNSPVSHHAFAFTQSLIKQNHTIARLFFFAEGAKNAHCDNSLATQWQQLMQQHKLAITVCSGSAHRFGLSESNSLLPIAGMGDWLTATLNSDRLVSF